MKKIAWLALLAALALGAGCLFTASAEEFRSGDFAYILLEDGTAGITQYKGWDAAVVIPESLDGYPVTSIGEFAFDRLYSGLASVTIPQGVVSIGDYAFSDCGYLASVSMPDSVKTIGVRAFRNCSSLTALALPEGLEEIDHPWLAVSDGVLFTRADKRLVCCTRAQARSVYEVPQGTLSIGDKAFRNCAWLAAVTIPDSVTAIGEEAFFRCPDLATVRIPGSVTSAGDDLFDRRHDNLTVIVDRNSYMERYCRQHEITFIYAEPGD